MIGKKQKKLGAKEKDHGGSEGPLLCVEKKVEPDHPEKEQGVCYRLKHDYASQRWLRDKPRLVSVAVKNIEIPVNAVQAKERGNCQANCDQD
jgi:hypothetical protein